MTICMSRIVLWCVVGGLVIGRTWSGPVPENLPLNLVSDLTTHLGPHTSRLQQEGRLPLPPDLETIKKVAQILVMLGQQVIPAIIDPQSSPAPGEPLEEVPNDPVNLDKQPMTA